MKSQLTLISLTAFMLVGCATRGADYVPLVDTKGKDLKMLQQDTAECQQFATQRAGAGSGAVAGAVVGGLLLAALAPSGSRNLGARQGAIVGGATGAVHANDTQETIIKRCLSGRGYNVLN